MINKIIDLLDTEKLPLVIYHDNCLDGFTAAWCFWHRYGDGFEYIPAQYKSKELPDVANRHVFLVDFSYPKATVFKILEACKSLTIWDHHKSAIEDLKNISDPKFFSDFNIEKSGAQIAWKNLFPKEDEPDIVSYTADRDLWKFTSPFTRDYCEGLSAEPKLFTRWEFQTINQEEKTRTLIIKGRTLREKFDIDLERLLTNSATYGMMEGYLVPFVNLPPLYASEAGNRLSTGNPFAVTYWLSGGELQVSLRSDNKDPAAIDVSEIAKFWDGGGHKNAAGFKLNNTIEILDFIERTLDQTRK